MNQLVYSPTSNLFTQDKTLNSDKLGPPPFPPQKVGMVLLCIPKSRFLGVQEKFGEKCATLKEMEKET